jgi:hypothetical protein
VEAHGNCLPWNTRATCGSYMRHQALEHAVNQVGHFRSAYPFEVWRLSAQVPSINDTTGSSMLRFPPPALFNLRQAARVALRLDQDQALG